MKTNFIIAIGISILLAACSSKSSDNSLQVSTNIDDIVSWGVNTPNIKFGDAHSGIYSSKVDSLTPFSVTFQKKLTDISKNKISKIEYQAWCKASILPKEVVFVCSVELENGEHVSYGSTPLDKQLLKVNEWTLIKGEQVLPKELPANTVVKIYLYSPNKEAVDIDDYEIKFIN